MEKELSATFCSSQNVDIYFSKGNWRVLELIAVLQRAASENTRS